MSEKYRKCNESCPGYLHHRGGWCGYAGSWGNQVKPGDTCHLGYDQKSVFKQPSPEDLNQPSRVVFNFRSKDLSKHLQTA